MKKLLLSFSLLALSLSGNAQNLFSQGFDTGTDLEFEDWVLTNQSTPATIAQWTVANFTAPTATTPFGGLTPNGQAGGLNSFVLVNYASTGVIDPTTGAASGSGDISNWMITPAINVKDGDIVSFWTRKGTSGTTDYPDRLELRMSTAATTVVPSTGATDLGSFTTLGVSVNPNLVAGFVYPKVWTKYSFVVTGVPTAADVKFAFRYFVTNGGNAGTNSDIIGVDTFSVDRTPLSTADFFSANLSMYPNPATNVINLASSSTVINSIKLTDVNGRVVKNVNTNGVAQTQLNIADLNTGLYFLTVKTDLGEGTAKVMKN